MSDPDPPSRFDGVSMLHYVETRFKDLEKATKTAYVELNRRLAALNNAHEIARQKDMQFYSKEMHEIYAKSIAEELRDVRNKIDEKTKPTYWWVGGIAALITMFGGVWYLSDVIARLDAAQKNALLELSNHNKEMEAFQKSLDGLIKSNGSVEPNHPPSRR